MIYFPNRTDVIVDGGGRKDVEELRGSKRKEKREQAESRRAGFLVRGGEAPGAPAGETVLGQAFKEKKPKMPVVYLGACVAGVG